MTKMLAEIVDFSIELDEEENIVAYYFRYGKTEDFYETHTAFKEQIHPSERKPFPDQNWLWRVEASKKTERILSKLFDNFHSSLELARAQLRMF